MNDVLYIVIVLAGCIGLVVGGAKLIEKRRKSFPRVSGEEIFFTLQPKSTRKGRWKMVVSILLFLGITITAVYYNNETLILICVAVVAAVYVLLRLRHPIHFLKLFFEGVKEQRRSGENPDSRP